MVDYREEVGIFEPDVSMIIGDWKKMCNVELHDLYQSRDIAKVMKSINIEAGEMNLFRVCTNSSFVCIQ
jgi:hypothetical protein